LCRPFFAHSEKGPGQSPALPYFHGRLEEPKQRNTTMNQRPTLLAGTLLAVLIALPAWPSGLAKINLSGYAPGKNACIAVYDSQAEQYLVHNMAQCQERLSPCSTFKIPNALIGLETRVLTGPEDTKEWDGTEHSRQVNNQHHDLASAIRNSVLWYFQEVAQDVGVEQMQAYLDAFDYGNRDISGGQDQFWLDSSLQITALEQIGFMAALDKGALPASTANQQTVKGMMLQEDKLPEGFQGDLYGKTGSCVTPQGDHGWFTGFYHRDGGDYVFAVNVKGKKQWGWQAREIAVAVLDDLP
jgi:beta-lactamase class D